MKRIAFVSIVVLLGTAAPVCGLTRASSATAPARASGCTAYQSLNLSKAGWSLGWVAALDLEGRTIWIVDAHGYGKRFIVRADEMLPAFLELQTAIHAFLR